MRAIEVPRAYIARTIPPLVVPVETSLQSLERLHDIGSLLETNPKLNAILYGLHGSDTDHFAASVAEGILNRNGHRTAAILVSEDRLKRDPMFAIGSWLGAELTGIKRIRTAQRSKGASLSEMNDNFWGIIGILKRAHKPLILIGYPQATRSDKFQPPIPAFFAYGSVLRPVVHIPFGIYYEGNIKREGITTNWTKNHGRIHFEIGEHTIQNDIKVPDTKLLWSKALATLPHNA